MDTYTVRCQISTRKIPQWVIRSGYLRGVSGLFRVAYAGTVPKVDLNCEPRRAPALVKVTELSVC